jgi:hypothetical protein
LFLLAEVSDWTGTCTVRLGEKAALAAARCSNRDQFLEHHARGTLTFQRVHLRLKRSVSQDGKQVNLVAVCARPAMFCPPVTFMGPVLDAKVLPATVAQLRNIPYGGLAVEVSGEQVPVRAALLLLNPGKEREHTSSEGFCSELRLAAAQDACAEGSAGVVPATVVAHGEAQKFLQTEDSGLLLVQVTNAVFTWDGALAEICCTEIQLVSEPDQEAIQAFQDELKAVQARVVQSRSVVKKRKFDTASLAWEEYFTPEKRRVCFGIGSPPTSPTDSGA